MIVGPLLIGAALGLLSLPALTRPLGRRVRPDRWARMCTGALMSGGVLLEVALLLYAAPTLFPAARVPLIAALCEHMIGPLVPGGAVAGWAAAVFAIAIPAFGVAGARSAARTWSTARVEPWLGEHGAWEEFEVVVLPTDHLLAMSVPGDPGQIVISAALVEKLDDAALEAVMRHEAAHLAHHHHRFLLTATVVETAGIFFLPARRGARVLRAALERWADEVAVSGRPAEREILRDALVEVTRLAVVPAGIAALSAADTIAERLQALDRAATPTNLIVALSVYVPGTLLAAAAVVAIAGWVVGAHMVWAMAGRCAPV